jgi:hypothetical protein
LLERELLRANTTACEAFYAKYFDDRGYLQCVERWGGDDGADDAIENCTNWPILHALGAPDRILHLYKQAWEGHLHQYTQARTTQVPFTRDGMYFKEFPVMFDWLHNAEGLTVFNLQGLSDPNDSRFRQRLRRYAGFYLNEDAGAPNYDPQHKLIRSLFNGSRGPLLRSATALDWAGDPIDPAHRFRLMHGEHNYEEMLQHFKDYTNIVGDHPLNLRATTLALNAYLATQESKYKRWLLEYVDAWRERMRENGGVIPTNIGLDGKIGSAADGKWYGGVYGWAFTVYDPGSGRLVHRNLHQLGLVGFGNAYLLTGDDRYLDPWRRMIDLINQQVKVVDGRPTYPHMYGDRGWYQYTPQKYSYGAEQLWYWSMTKADRQRLPQSGWIAYLEGQAPNYPEEALRQDYQTLRQRVVGMQADTTTPDTRLSDNPLPFNPATVDALVHLVLGGLPPGNSGSVLHCRLRYFDPERHRAGLPEQVAALVEGMTTDQTIVSLVNLDPVHPRRVLLQAGAYAEHRWTHVSGAGQTLSLDSPTFSVELDPGCGARLTLGIRRYVNTPTMALPWDRDY